MNEGGKEGTEHGRHDEGRKDIYCEEDMDSAVTRSVREEGIEERFGAMHAWERDVLWHSRWDIRGKDYLLSSQ